MKVLAGDIGGTKTNLGLFEVNKQQVYSLFEVSFASSEYQSLEEIIECFFANKELSNLNINDLEFVTTSACFGVAGPVNDNHCEVTNLPWIVDASQIQQKFGFQNVNLLNDYWQNSHPPKAHHLR